MIASSSVARKTTMIIIPSKPMTMYCSKRLRNFPIALSSMNCHKIAIALCAMAHTWRTDLPLSKSAIAPRTQNQRPRNTPCTVVHSCCIRMEPVAFTPGWVVSLRTVGEQRYSVICRMYHVKYIAAPCIEIQTMSGHTIEP